MEDGGSPDDIFHSLNPPAIKNNTIIRVYK